MLALVLVIAGTNGVLAGQRPATLAPLVGSVKSTGTDVWVVVDGEMPRPPPQDARLDEWQTRVPYRIKNLDGPGYNQRQGLYTPGSNSVFDPLESVPESIQIRHQPSPPEDRDAYILSSIPAYAEAAEPVDAGRYMKTQVALNMQNATIEQVLNKLIPRGYRVQMDLPESMRTRRFDIAFDTTVAEAFTTIREQTGVIIRPYHRLGIILLTMPVGQQK
ncbi:MAG: hypothetical protein E6Q76_14490 [Rhizobium sp.]|nr:MAG: hypothetical protein E6Q76_14490 [Rhizobium sp.]